MRANQLKPEEVLEWPLDAQNYYSIIIGDLDPEWSLTEHIQARVYQKDENGKIKVSQKGTPYGRYTKAEDYLENNMLTNPVYGFSTPQESFNSQTDTQKEICNMIKSLLNSRPCAAFWHNGTLDDGCEFNGLHMHVILHNTFKLNDSSRYKSLQSLARKYNFVLKYQRVKYLDSILAHMLKPPRTLLGCNNMHLCARLLKNNTKDESKITEFVSEKEALEEVVDEPKKMDFMTRMLGIRIKDVFGEEPKQPINNMERTIMELSRQEGINDVNLTQPMTTFKSKLVDRVEQVKKYLNKYNKTTTKEILKEIYQENNMEDLNEWRSLTTTQYFNKIWVQAIEEKTIEDELAGHTYIWKIISECPAVEESMSTEETASTFLKWCKEQQLSPGLLCQELFAVLGKKYPKLNTMALIGASNAGKTFWANSLMPWSGDVGQTVQSQDFAFQKCYNKKIIRIPEMTLTTMTQVEEAKKIFEGQETTINIKNKEPQLLKRTPIIMTSNQTPWRAFDDESKAFKNRMYLHANLRSSDVLQNVGSPDPRMWQKIFAYMAVDMRLDDEFPEQDDECMWQFNADMIEEYIKNLANQGYRKIKTLWKNISVYDGILEKEKMRRFEIPRLPQDARSIDEFLKQYFRRRLPQDDVF